MCIYTCTTASTSRKVIPADSLYLTTFPTCVTHALRFYKQEGYSSRQTSIYLTIFPTCVYTCTTASTNMQEGYSSRQSHVYTHAPQLPQTCRKVINDKVCMHSCMMMHLHVIVLMFTHLQVCMLLCFVV